MLNDLIKLATHLDRRGLTKEADYLDSLIKTSNASAIDLVPPQFQTALKSALEPVMSRITDKVVDKIAQDVYSSCFSGFGNKAGLLFRGGLNEDQKSCVSEKASEAILEEVTNPANIAELLGAGAGAISSEGPRIHPPGLHGAWGGQVAPAGAYEATTELADHVAEAVRENS